MTRRMRKALIRAPRSVDLEPNPPDVSVILWGRIALFALIHALISNG